MHKEKFRLLTEALIRGKVAMCSKNKGGFKMYERTPEIRQWISDRSVRTHALSTNIDRLVRRARVAGWTVDASGYNPGRASRVVFAVLIAGFKATVFYTPAEKRFFGILRDGTVFNSDDRTFVSEPWFTEIFNFFMGK